MRHRIFVLFLILSLLVPLSTVNGANTPSPVQQSQQAESTLSVIWMRSPSDSPELKELIESFATDFEAANPKTKINITFVDWAEGHDAITKAVADGKPPDISVIGARWVPEFVANGYIEPLDGYITKDFRKRFVQSIINEGALYQGRTFGLPIATSTRALYYNQDIFETAGISKPPTSWDELLESSKKINAQGKDFYGFGLQGGGGLETNTYFYYFIWGNGGDLYNAGQTASAINSPQAVEALEFLRTMITENATQPDPTSKDWERRKNLEDLFQAGKLAMVISGPWFAPRLRKEAPNIKFGLAPLPYKTTSATYGVMDALVMFKTSQNKDLSWSFMEFLYDAKRRENYAKIAGLLPELADVAKLPTFTENKDASTFLELLPEARFEPLNIKSEDIAATVIKAVQAAYRGDIDPQTALDEAAEAINKLITVSSAGW